MQDCQTSGIRLSIQKLNSRAGKYQKILKFMRDYCKSETISREITIHLKKLRKLICEGETKVRECYNNDYPFAAAVIFIRVLLFQVCVPEPVGVRARL